MPLTSLANINSFRMQELGADPDTPEAGFALIYAKADGFYIRTSDGTIAGPFGSGGSSALNDLSDVISTSPSVGDILAYNGSNWVEFSAGTNGQVLSADSGEATGMNWIDPVFSATDEDAQILLYLGLSSNI